MKKNLRTEQKVPLSLDQVVQTIKQFIAENPDEKITIFNLKQFNSQITEDKIKRLGGITRILSAHFPDEKKSLSTISKLNKQGSYIHSLEKRIGDREAFQEDLKKAILANISPLPKISFKKPFKKKNRHGNREVVAMLNDTHVGAIIDSDEIGDLNSFDFKEAGRRFAYYIREVAEYKKDKRSLVTKLHVVLNGDLTAGIIHGLETKGIHLLVHQQNALTHILVHALTYLLQAYKEVEVHGIAGNHERMVHKNHGKRAVTEVYDSYANLVFYALSVGFRNNPRIKFNFPKTPYGFINLPAGRAMYAHGDHVFSSVLGNPGKAINVKAISSAIKDFNAGEIAKGNAPIKLLLLGHVHVFAHFITNDGVEVYIAPSLSGTDGFAHSLTINTNFAAQVVFESTEDFILGDSRLVRVTEADKMAELDEIIPTYNKELKWVS